MQNLNEIEQEIVKELTGKRVNSDNLATLIKNLKSFNIIGFNYDYMHNIISETLGREATQSESQRLSRFMRLFHHGFKLMPNGTFGGRTPEIETIYL